MKIIHNVWSPSHTNAISIPDAIRDSLTRTMNDGNSSSCANKSQQSRMRSGGLLRYLLKSIY